MSLIENINFSENKQLGIKLCKDGVLFSIFSRNASKMWLLLYKEKDLKEPDFIIELDREKNRIGDVWFIFVKKIYAGWYYLWKADGDNKFFNKQALLLDPYAKVITGEINSYPDEKTEDSVKYFSQGNKTAKAMIYDDDFDWEGDKPLKLPLSKTIIYETHLRGFTVDKSSKVKNKGTYLGIIEKIPYLKELGITAVEFLPLNEFSSYKDNRTGPNSDKPLNNYWGYNTLGYFAPNGRYATGNSGKQVKEFKEMVKALHKAGIEVILDIVFNHTVEGGKYDKIMSFKGLDNSIYYIIDSETGEYLDYTGCGNTFNCNNPVVSDFIIDVLSYWVLDMHIDGFRFDLASALNRDENGILLDYSPLINRIEQSPLLRDTKIIAEAWDAGGAYQVGGFKGRWSEWNGRYRDDIRRFWRGDRGTLGNFATRITGSSDLFKHNKRKPQQSINFIFSHDGFTLWDWVSYNEKHNIDNGHNNEDGENNNFSFNHGNEGETDDIRINKNRLRRAKNLIATLFLSLGTPMINGGDEFLRTQKGNNNPYCQDNEITWFDWKYLKKNKDFFNFFKKMIEMRKSLFFLFDRNFYYENEKDDNNISWFNSTGKIPDWEGDDLSICVYVKNNIYGDVLLIFNANKNKKKIILPEITPEKWVKILDTSKKDSFKLGKVNLKDIYVERMSIIVLKTKTEKKNNGK